MKTRLDVLMVERGLAESREKAKAIIMSDPSAFCISIDFSGESMCLEPSI